MFIIDRVKLRAIIRFNIKDIEEIVVDKERDY